MPKVYDTAIVGGGIYGAALAYYASKYGSCILLEKETIGGAGATSFSKGMVRVFDNDEQLLELNYHGALSWNAISKISPSIYKPAGCIYLLKNGKRKYAQTICKKYSSEKYPIHLVEKKKLFELYPYINLNHVDFAIYEPNGGYGNPVPAARFLAEESRHQGCDTLENCQVFRIDKMNDEVKHLYLNNTLVQAKKVILACGAFINPLKQKSPTFTRTIPMSYFNWSFDKNMPCIIHDEIGCYIRPTESNGFYLGGMQSKDFTCPSKISCDMNKIGLEASELINKLFITPALDKPLYSYNGFDSYTENLRPIVKRVDKTDDIYELKGFSGRGFKYSLALAETFISTNNKVEDKSYVVAGTDIAKEQIL